MSMKLLPGGPPYYPSISGPLFTGLFTLLLCLLAVSGGPLPVQAQGTVTNATTGC